MANKVKFFYTDDLQKFLSLEVKDPVSLYFVDDANAGFTGLYRGESLIATGSLASIQANGLMSSADKQNLDDLLERVDSVEERLDAVEQAAIGGVHYKGSVPTESDLPANAKQGDLYEVSEDSSEWCFNGEKWFKYGTAHFAPVAENGIEINSNKIGVKIADESNGLVADESGLAMELATKEKSGAMSAEDKRNLDAIPDIYASKAEMNSISQRVKYDVFFKPAGTTVMITDSEIRICCPSDVEWKDQAVGPTGDPNRFYVGLKIYAPIGADHFMEDLKKTIEDPTVFDFTDDFSGRDAYGNGYSVVYLPVAAKQEDGTWKYYGDMSTEDKQIGWYYTSAFYDADNNLLSKETIRINVVNENMSTEVKPYYLSSYATKEEVAALESSVSWETL